MELKKDVKIEKNQLSVVEREKGWITITAVVVVIAVAMWLNFAPDRYEVSQPPSSYAKDIAMDMVRDQIPGAMNGEFDYSALKMIDLGDGAFRIVGKVATPAVLHSWNVEIVAKEKCSDYDEKKCWEIQKNVVIL